MRVSAAEYARFRKAVVDIVAASPDGVTLTGIQTALFEKYEMYRSKRSISTVIREIRKACNGLENHDLFIVADNPGDGTEWKYRFTARLGDSVEWAAWRSQSIESQLETMIAYYSSIMESSIDSAEVWKAKVARKALTRAFEDISSDAHPA